MTNLIPMHKIAEVIKEQRTDKWSLLGMIVYIHLFLYTIFMIRVIVALF